jgi:Fungal specific transcription factor domain
VRNLSMVPQSSLVPLHGAPSTADAIQKVCYPHRSSRNPPDHLTRSVEKISQTLQQYRGILQKLFPNIHPEQLQGLPREKLVDLISRTSLFQAPSPITSCSDDKPPSTHPDAGSLEQLQPLPEDFAEPFDTQPKALRGVTDDVNALALSMKHSSSYLGISSVMAALRVILWLDPECQALVNKTPNRSHLASRSALVAPDCAQKMTTTVAAAETQGPSAWDEVPIINAYFQYIHPFVPLVDEHTFRDTYMAKQRTDSRWSLLLNTVLAMGSIANGEEEDNLHSIYFDRAKEHLNMDTLGSAHIETVQALAMLSGFYLHYIQQPNVANTLMGAALRMATALGLHRDYTEGLGPASTGKAQFSVEMRRRVWWSTFILDTWASNTLGRPSMGRWSHAITARPPQEPIVSRHSLRYLRQLTLPGRLSDYDNFDAGKHPILRYQHTNGRFTCNVSAYGRDRTPDSRLSICGLV